LAVGLAPPPLLLLLLWLVTRHSCGLAMLLTLLTVRKTARLLLLLPLLGAADRQLSISAASTAELQSVMVWFQQCHVSPRPELLKLLCWQ
jgi:hypothetical protein